jgi:phosphoethanolamine N-methyltransferase
MAADLTLTMIDPENRAAMNPEAPHDYDPAMVEMLQLIWGDGFLSPGGAAAVREIMADIPLDGRRVLDIGCGVGGLDRELVRLGDCHVTAVDVARPLVEIGRERIAAAGLSDRIDFRPIEPEQALPFADESFDIVFAKDAWLHIPDKRSFLSDVFRVLRPGGRIAAGDWMKGPGPFSADMLYFIELEGIPYHPASMAEYGLLLHEAGFVDVRLLDLNAWYCEEAKRELERLRGELYSALTEKLGSKVRDHFLEDWRMLTVVLDKGELRPGRLWAKKP